MENPLKALASLVTESVFNIYIFQDNSKKIISNKDGVVIYNGDNHTGDNIVNSHIEDNHNNEVEMIILKERLQDYKERLEEYKERIEELKETINLLKQTIQYTKKQLTD